MSRRAYWLVVAPLLALALQGCGGGGGGSSDPADSDSGATAAVTEDNALSVAQAGTQATSGTGSTGDEFTDFANVLSGIAPSSTATAGGADFTIQETADVCENTGGTLEYFAQSTSTGTTIEYNANNCQVGGEILNGTIVLTTGTWDEHPSGGTETFLETEGTFQAGECSFEGAFGFRIYAEIPTTTGGDGDYLFEFEYGTSTDRGLLLTCTTGESLVIAADTMLNNVLRYTVSGGTITSSSLVTTASGGFESPDGDGTLVFTTNNLEYQADQTDTDAEFGNQTCPSGGTITITGADDNQVTVSFGDDADTGAVQVEGPNYNETYPTCSEFLDATP